MKNKYLILISAFLLVTGNMFGQIAPQLKPQSPNVASLGHYGQTDVSLFTGKPSISVDLFTLQEGAVNIPLKLVYDPSGVKVDVYPSWVGLNWNLDCGGVIYRKINMHPDDYYPLRHPSIVGYTLLKNVSQTGSYLSETNWSQNSQLNQYLKNSYLSVDSYDTEPDEYTFSFLGYRGKFYYGQNNTWRVQCDNQQIQVELLVDTRTYPNETAASAQFINTYAYPPFYAHYLNNSYNIWSYTPSPFNTQGYPFYSSKNKYQPHFRGFVLTDEQGIKYQFGSHDELQSAVEYSIPFWRQGYDTWLPTSWHLTKIIMPNSEEISFEYERGNFINQMSHSYSAYQGLTSNNWTSCNTSSSGLLNHTFDGSLISPVYLNRILSKNYEISISSVNSTQLKHDVNSDLLYKNYINFHLLYNSPSNSLELSKQALLQLSPTYQSSSFNSGNGTMINTLNSEFDSNLKLLQLINSLQLRKISTISIVSNGGVRVGRYFDLLYNDSPSERLMLNEVVENQYINGTKTKLSSTKLDYYTYNDTFLPEYFKSHTDHWGFNNGIAFNFSDFTYSFDTTKYKLYGDTYRKVATDIKQSLVGTLKKVTYPTGGYTIYDFEQHDYQKRVNENRWSPIIQSPTITNKLNAGGLRVRRITNYDLNDSLISNKEYFYVSNYNYLQPSLNTTSSGNLGGIYRYYWANYRLSAYDGNMGNEQTTYLSRFSTSSFYPISENTEGNHVGYSEVTVKDSGTLTGYSNYKFSNFDNGYLDDKYENNIYGTPSDSPYRRYNSKSFMRGKLLSEEHYDKNATLRRRTINTYGLIGDSNTQNFIRGIRSSSNASVCPSEITGSFIEGTAYQIYLYKYLLQKAVTSNY